MTDRQTYWQTYWPPTSIVPNSIWTLKVCQPAMPWYLGWAIHCTTVRLVIKLYLLKRQCSKVFFLKSNFWNLIVLEENVMWHYAFLAKNELIDLTWLRLFRVLIDINSDGGKTVKVSEKRVDRGFVYLLSHLTFPLISCWICCEWENSRKGTYFRKVQALQLNL